MNDFLVASHNSGKIREIRDLLERAGTAWRAARPSATRPFAPVVPGSPSLRVLSLVDVGITHEVEETGETFRENAIAKALEYSRLFERVESPRGVLTLADDSGLEVKALGGAPGVKSARYGGPGLTDEERCSLLLREMKDVSWTERTARFVCVLALAREGELVRCFEGTVEGVIAFESSGTHGFGYDPIFYYPPLGGTFGDLAPAEKDEVSHRGQALRKLEPFIKEGDLGE